MKRSQIRQLTARKTQIQRGEITPAAVWELKPNDKGSFTPRRLNPKQFQRENKKSWASSI